MGSAVPNSTRSAVRKQHPLETMPKGPDEDLKLPALDLRPTQTTGQHRRTIAESSQRLESPRPSKRPRLYCGAMDMQEVRKGGELGDGQGHGSTYPPIVR